MGRARAPQLTGSLAVLAGAVLWGTTGTSQELAPAGATPTTVGLLRVLVGGATLVVVAAAGTRAWPRPALPPALIVAATGVVAYQLCFFHGVARAGVATGTLVTLATAPAVAGGLQWLTGRRRPTGSWYLATLLAIVGTALLVTATPATDPGGAAAVAGASGAPAGGDGPGRAWGIALAVGAGASFAVLTVAGKRLLDDGWSPAASMGGAFGLAALAAGAWLVADAAGVPAAGMTGAGVTGPSAAPVGWVATPRGAAVALWLGVGTAAAAYLLYAAGLRHLEPPTVTTLSLAEPVTAAALGVVVLGERLTPVAVVGALLVAAGLAVVAVAPLLASRRTTADGSRARSGSRRGR